MLQGDTKCSKCSKEEKQEKEKLTFDLFRGDASTFRKMKHNNISTAKYNKYNFLPYTLFQNFIRMGNLFFLIISLIMLINQTLSPFYNWIVIFPLGFYTLAYMIKELIFDKAKSSNDEFINNQITQRGRKKEGSIEENVRWADVQVGDILRLQKGDTVPADMILLDSGQIKDRSALCFIDTYAVDGKIDLTIKKASYLTQMLVTRVRQKNNYIEYRKKLTGKIEYEIPSAQIGRFDGSLKLKKDPKIEQLTWDNFIPRGSVIRQTSWIFGLVVYAGMDTKIYQNSNHKKTKQSYIERLSQWLFLFVVFVVGIFAVISVIVLVARSKDLKFLLQYDSEAANGVQIFSYVILYAQSIPIGMYFFLDIITFFNKFQALETNKSYLKIIRAETISDLGQVEYLLLDKTGTLTDGEFQIDMVGFGQEQYFIDYQQLTQTLNKKKTQDLGVNPKSNSMKLVKLQVPKDLQDKPFSEEDYYICSEKNVDFLKLDHDMEQYNMTNRKNTHHQRNSFSKILSPLTVNLNVPKLLSSQIQLSQKQLISQKNLMSQKQLYSQILKPIEQKIIHTQNDVFIANLKESEQNTLFDSFLKAVCLCHEAKPAYCQIDEITYEGPSREEKVALDFTRLCGYSLEKVTVNQETSNIACQLRLPYDPHYTMNLLGVNNFTHSRRMNSVVVDNDILADDSIFSSESGGATLVCKGDPDSIRPLLILDEEESLQFEYTLTQYRERGVRVYAYATRELSAEQRNDYKKQYQSFKSSLMSQDERLEQLAKEIETKLSLIGFLCFKDEVRSDAHDLLKMCHDAAINPWLLSGDSQINVLNASIKCGMIDQALDKGLIIKSTNKIEIGSEIKAHLSVIKSETMDKPLTPVYRQEPIKTQELNKNQLKQAKVITKQTRRMQTLNTVHSVVKGESYDNMLKYYLQVSGESLDIILHDRYLYQHFCFLACICKRMLGHNLTPYHKMRLCSIIQDKFPKSPTVMAVGDGYNDALMLSQANIGVELVRLDKDGYPQVLSNSGDIQVINLRQLEEMILVNGRNAFERAQNVLHYLFYKGVLLGLPMFYFNWYCTFTGTTLHDSMFIFLYNFLFNILNIILIGIYDEPCDPQVLRQFPALHIDGQRYKNIKLLPFLMRSILESFVQSTLIFYFSIYVIQSSVNSQGQRSDINMLSLIIIYSIIVVFNLKTLFTCAYRVKSLRIVYFTSLLSIMLVIAFVTANIPGKFSRDNFAVSTQELFQRFDSWLCLIYNVLCSLLVSYFINVVIRPRMFPTLYETYANFNIEGLDWKYWKNETIIKRETKHQLNMSKIVRQIFTQQDTLDSNVQELINPADIKVIEMKLDKISLKIVDKNIQSKFNTNSLRTSVISYRITYGLVLLCFGIWSMATTIDFDQTEDQQVFSFTRLGLFLFFLFLLVSTYFDFFKVNYYSVSVQFIGAAIVVKAIYDWSVNDINIALSAVLLMSLSTLAHVNLDFLTSIVYMFLYVAQFTLRIIFLYFSIEISSIQDQFVFSSNAISQDDFKLIQFFACTSVIVQVLFIAVILGYTYYMGVKQKRYDFLAKEQIEVEQQLSDDILSLLVPSFVKAQMAQGKYTMAEAQDDVSILFLYICDFDSIMNEEGKNVVPMLDNLFRLYDNLCVQHGVQKIETVGYTYMAAAGIKACEGGISQHILSIEKTMRLVNLAFDMKKQITGKVYGSKSIQIDLKVGIHVGRVIAGVIGHHKPQFSLIGDPINYTSRVCSTGQVGAITLSNDAYSKARATLKYVKKVQVEMKGLGMVENFQVFEERPVDMKQTNFQVKVKKLFDLQKSKVDGVVKKSSNPVSLEGSMVEYFKASEKKVDITQKSGLQLISKIFSHKQTPTKKINDNDHNLVSVEDELQDEFEDDTSPAIEQLLKPNPILLTVPAFQSEEHYNQRQLLKRSRLRIEMYLIVFFWVIYLFQTLILLSVQKFFNTDYLKVFATRAIFLVLLVLFSFHQLAYENKLYQYMYTIFLCYGAVTPSIQSYYTNVSGIQTVGVVELMMILIAAGNLSIFNFVQIILITLTGFFSFFLLYGVNEGLTQNYIFFLVIGVIFVYLNKYITMNDQIKSYNNIQINQVRKTQMEDFVSQLLPTHAFNKMKQFNLHDKTELTDEFDDVSILFADIKGFTAFSNSVQPEAVVTMLRELFTEFDKLCQKYKVYKVYTIGDCYVVLGFINSANRKPELEALNTVKLGLEMVEIIREVRKRINFPGLDMRIGVHTGKMIGGIIGTSIVRYDIYGQDVSIANKMESNGVEGNIMVSESTKHMLGKIFHKNQKREIKIFLFSSSFMSVSRSKNSRWRQMHTQSEQRVKKIIQRFRDFQQFEQNIKTQIKSVILIILTFLSLVLICTNQMYIQELNFVVLESPPWKHQAP